MSTHADRIAAALAQRQTWAVCHTCRMKHPVAPGSDEAAEFFARHAGHHIEACAPSSKLAKLGRITGANLFRLVRNRLGEWIIGYDRIGIANYAGNANVKQAFGTASTFTKTNANRPSSPTAGWMGNAIDNTTNLYDDAHVQLVLAAVNTAPADSKAIFLFAAGLVDSSGTAYTSTGDGTPSGSEGTLTHPDVTTSVLPIPLLGVVPYPVQNKAINGSNFSVAACFGGVLPPKWLPTMVNHSGMTLSVTNINYREIYWTVT